ncbi:MAG TPA: hypothetical protein VE196_10040 [Pseudonocardiaceae bacterium]|nr:hypothetical protein [Pseudonocardiaceae bacterium]
MDVGAIAVLVAGTGLLGIVVWVLAKIGQLLIKVVEVLAGAAVRPVTAEMAVPALSAPSRGGDA